MGTSLCSRRRRLPVPSAALGAPIPVVSIGPQTSAAARAVGHPRDRGSASRTISTASSTRSLGSQCDATGDHVPHRLRRRRRLRGHVPRRDEADHAGGGDHRHHARHRAAAGAPGRSRAARTRCPYMPEGRPSRSRRPQVGTERKAIVVQKRRRPAARRARQRPAHPRGRADGRHRRGVGARPMRGFASSRFRARFTAATSSRLRLRTSPAGSIRASWERRSSRRRSSGSTCRSPGSAGRDRRTRPDRRPLRQRPAQPHGRRRRAGSASCQERSSSSRSGSSGTTPWPRETFADVGPGDIVLYEDSYRNIAIAINNGDAASVVLARPGDPVRIRARR